MRSVLETWDGEVRTVLFKNGDFAIYVGPKNGSLREGPVLEGSAENEEL